MRSSRLPLTGVSGAGKPAWARPGAVRRRRVRRLGSVADPEQGSYALSSMTSASATPL